MSQEIISRVKQYILQTRDHLVNSCQESTILMDADLKILSSSEKKYLKYNLNIQKEYSHLTKEEYLSGRNKFLENFLKKVTDINNQIYKHLPKKYSLQAIQNIYSELHRNKY
jgi:predicted metal-dependent HD superfamily phosphohydrolase